MKIGVFSVLFSKLSFEQMLNKVAGLGLECVEIGTGGYAGSAHCEIERLLASKKTARDFLKRIQDAGLFIGALSYLWQLVNASVENPPETLNQIRLLRNYDSLRHGFRKAFGCSPRQMMLQLKMQNTRNLLLETGLSMKEIAARSGHARQQNLRGLFAGMWV